jgi:hypothetical protein
MIFAIILLYLLIFIIFLSFLFLILDFSVILSYNEKSFIIKIKALGFTIKIPKIKDKKAKQKKEKKIETQDTVMKKFLDLRNEFTRKKNALSLTLSYLKGKIKIYETGIAGKFGLGNAAATGIAYGSLHAFLGVFTGFLGNLLQLEKLPSVNIDLDYDKIVFDIQFLAVIKIKPYHLLNAAIIFYKNK